MSGAGWSSRVIGKTSPTAPAGAEKIVGEAISCPVGGPAGCGRWICIDGPLTSMNVSSIGLPEGNGGVGVVTPGKPVTIVSPGDMIASV